MLAPSSHHYNNNNYGNCCNIIHKLFTSSFMTCSLSLSLSVFLGAASIKGDTRAHKSRLFTHVWRLPTTRHVNCIRTEITKSHGQPSETDTGNTVFCWKFRTIVIFRKLIRQKFVFNIHQLRPRFHPFNHFLIFFLAFSFH
jgi:hypothetical protein